METSLQKRLSIDQKEELHKLLGLYMTGNMPVYNADMKDHFKIAKKKDDAFINHPMVLGISFGGTNTKVILASMKKAEMLVHHISTVQNPKKSMHLFQFLDIILFSDKIFSDYLMNTPHPIVGISVPTRVIGKIPIHETKIPTIEGLLARNESMPNNDYNLHTNFNSYLNNKKLPEAILFYQGDGIVAHHGAVSMCDIGVNDRSTLFVCGTGMATGDEEAYIQIGIAKMLDVGDEELYPADKTENYQYHYATAGKGIYGLMDRAIKIRAAEPGSALQGYDLSTYFSDNHGTRTVSLIWRSSLCGFNAENEALKLRDYLTPEAYFELQCIAGFIMNRCIQSMANATVSTIAKMGRAPSGNGHFIFFEGSIANDVCVYPKLTSLINKIISDKNNFVSFNIEAPIMPKMDIKMHNILPCNGVLSDDMTKVDLTVIGAATIAMTENLRRLTHP